MFNTLHLLRTRITFLYLVWIKNAWFDEWKWDDISFLLFKFIVIESRLKMRLENSKQEKLYNPFRVSKSKNTIQPLYYNGFLDMLCKMNQIILINELRINIPFLTCSYQQTKSWYFLNGNLRCSNLKLLATLLIKSR